MFQILDTTTRSSWRSNYPLSRAALTDLLSSTELVIENLQKTAADYSNPEVQVARSKGKKLRKYFPLLLQSSRIHMLRKQLML